MTPIEELDPRDLADFLAAHPDAVVLDVREPFERDLVAIPNSLHIPLREIPTRLPELSAECPVVAYCHHGMRSRHVGEFLASEGFATVKNLSGGIHAYALLVDPTLPTY